MNYDVEKVITYADFGLAEDHFSHPEVLVHFDDIYVQESFNLQCHIYMHMGY